MAAPLLKAPTATVELSSGGFLTHSPLMDIDFGPIQSLYFAPTPRQIQYMVRPFSGLPQAPRELDFAAAFSALAVRNTKKGPRQSRSAHYAERLCRGPYLRILGF